MTHAQGLRNYGCQHQATRANTYPPSVDPCGVWRAVCRVQGARKDRLVKELEARVGRTRAEASGAQEKQAKELRRVVGELEVARKALSDREVNSCCNCCTCIFFAFVVVVVVVVVFWEGGAEENGRRTRLCPHTRSAVVLLTLAFPH